MFCLDLAKSRVARSAVLSAVSPVDEGPFGYLMWPWFGISNRPFCVARALADVEQIDRARNDDRRGGCGAQMTVPVPFWTVLSRNVSLPRGRGLHGREGRLTKVCRVPRVISLCSWGGRARYGESASIDPRRESKQPVVLGCRRFRCRPVEAGRGLDRTSGIAVLPVELGGSRPFSRFHLC